MLLFLFKKSHLTKWTERIGTVYFIAPINGFKFIKYNYPSWKSWWKYGMEINELLPSLRSYHGPMNLASYSAMLISWIGILKHS